MVEVEKSNDYRGTGFIGSWLVKELLGNQVEVLLLIRNNSMGTVKK